MTEPARNATFSAGGRPVRAASAVRTFERTATFMPMKPAAAESTAPIRKPTAAPQPELVVEAEQQERDDRDDRDRRVLAAQVRRGAFLHGARDLLHPLGARGLAEEPAREAEAVDDGRRRAEQREENCMVRKPAHRFRAPPGRVRVTKSAPGSPGAGDYVSQAPVEPSITAAACGRSGGRA